MVNTIYLVVTEMSGYGGMNVICACDDSGFAREKAAQHQKENPETRPFVIARGVERRPPKMDYRVWIRLEEKCIDYVPEARMSIPSVRDTFEPLDTGAKYHGSVTVEATSPEEAIERAKKVVRAYCWGDQVAFKPMVPRRSDHVIGEAGI